VPGIGRRRKTDGSGGLNCVTDERRDVRNKAKDDGGSD